MLRILVAVLLVAAFSAPLRAAGEVGTSAPDFEFLDSWNMPGGQNRLSSFRGSVVLLETFASWCPHCPGTVPHLNKFHQQFAPRGFTVVSVSDEDDFTIGGYTASLGAKYPVARALGVGRMFGNTAVPHAWLISASGSILWEGHPGKLTADRIETALGGVTAPTAAQGVAGESSDSWWIWLIVGPGILFAGAMGWFLWSTRDRTAKYQTQFYPQQQYAPQGHGPPGQPPAYPPPQAYGQPPSYPQQQAYPNNAVPQPFPQQPGQPPSYPMQEPFQQGGYHGSPSSVPLTRVVPRSNIYGADGAMESPGAAGKAEPPPLEQRPYLGQNPNELPPFDASRNPPRQW